MTPQAGQSRRNASTGQKGASAQGARSRTFSVLRTATRTPRLAGRGLIQLYRHTLSGFVGFHCRHLPTCSEYADEAIDRHGLWAGGWMTLARLARCHPLGSSGIDPAPQNLPANSRWYLPWRYGQWTGRHIAERWDDGQAS